MDVMMTHSSSLLMFLHLQLGSARCHRLLAPKKSTPVATSMNARLSTLPGASLQSIFVLCSERWVQAQERSSTPSPRLYSGGYRMVTGIIANEGVACIVG